MARGSSLKDWQIRYYILPGKDEESLLSFTGSRDIEVKSKDEFICLFRPGDNNMVQFVNRTVGTSWGMWPVDVNVGGGGCCALALGIAAVTLVSICAAVLGGGG